MAAIVVTGGFGTLGRAVGLQAVRQGWQVALVDVAAAPAADLIEDKRFACFPSADLTDEAATFTLFEKIDAQFGGIAALANVAGGFTWVPTEEAGLESWKKMFDMNLGTAVSASRAALPALKRTKGAIVNIGAYAALKAAGGMAPYTAAKSGVHRLTEAMAEELRAAGVRVNAVLPTIIDTPANRRDMPDVDASLWIAPDELAKIILFLVSAEAAAINGALLPVTK
jgi:NAD(P)-dependent dehydrogenase (short-subunit alcohol dehydrogenase family)